jgi:hypothetical protein
MASPETPVSSAPVNDPPVTVSFAEPWSSAIPRCFAPM